MQAQTGRAQPTKLQSGPPHSLKYLSLGNSSPKVNQLSSLVSRSLLPKQIVISTEAAHAFVSRAAEKSASPHRLPPSQRRALVVIPEENLLLISADLSPP